MIVYSCSGGGCGCGFGCGCCVVFLLFCLVFARSVACFLRSVLVFARSVACSLVPLSLVRSLGCSLVRSLCFRSFGRWCPRASSLVSLCFSLLAFAFVFAFAFALSSASASAFAFAVWGLVPELQYLSSASDQITFCGGLCLVRACLACAALGPHTRTIGLYLSRPIL